MKKKGVVIRGGADEVIESRAARAGLGISSLRQAQEPGEGALPFEKNLIVQAGTRVPWDLLPAAWHFLERWDAAVPLWRYGVLAADVGTAEERAATQAVVRDLRVLLHSVELVFVRRNEAGGELIAAWKEEVQCFETGDWRLAFLRAMYRVKPRLCVLPTTWLAEVQQWQTLAASSSRGGLRRVERLEIVEAAPGIYVKRRAGENGAVWTPPKKREVEMAIVNTKSFVMENEKSRSGRGPLVRVQVGGRWVKMYQADAAAQKLVTVETQANRPAQEDKARPAENEKMVETAVIENEPAQTVVDFSTIDGVGPATARRIVAQGIGTYEQLRTADLGFLSGAQQQAIRAWIEAENG